MRDRILDEIASGQLASGERLGGERDLAEHYAVSRTTLRAALALGEVVNIRTPEANLEEIFLDYYRAQPEDSGG